MSLIRALLFAFERSPITDSKLETPKIDTAACAPSGIEAKVIVAIVNSAHNELETAANDRAKGGKFSAK